MSQVSKHRRSKDVKVARVMNQGQGEGRNNFKVKEQDSDDKFPAGTSAQVDVATPRKRLIEVEVGKVLPGGKCSKLNQNWIDCGCPVVQIHRQHCPRPLYLPEIEVMDDQEFGEPSDKKKEVSHTPKTLLRHIQQHGIRTRIMKLRELERYWMDQLADAGLNGLNSR